MKNATRTVLSTFGALMALAGIEHGIGAILQGNTAPEGIMILSWPDSPFFRLQNGEPAMTLIPNFLATGILACLFSLAYLVWVVGFVERRHSGRILALLAVAMLLTGGGLFPPVLALLLAPAAAWVHTPPAWARTRPAAAFGKIWPWAFAACCLAWLTLSPGTNLLDYYLGFDSALFMAVVLIAALTLLLLTVLTGLAFDGNGKGPKPAASGLSVLQSRQN